MSVGLRRIVQKSGVFGSKISERSSSSDWPMDASARITASSRLATSDSAWTTSMGASVPISTRDCVLRSDSCARSSDCWATFSELIAKT